MRVARNSLASGRYPVGGDAAAERPRSGQWCLVSRRRGVLCVGNTCRTCHGT